MTALLVLGAGRMQTCLIDAAREDGLVVVAIDPDRYAPGLARADHAYSWDLADTERCLAVARKHGISGVVTIAADYPMPTLAFLCETLALPGPSRNAVCKATDKAAMRAALAEAGIASPAFRETTGPCEAVAAAGDIPGPLVVKPALSSGGRGITYLPTAAERNETLNAFKHASRHSRNGKVVVEAYIEGPEFSLETITIAGRTEVVAITEKRTSGAPHFVETGHCLPCSLPDQVQQALRQTAKAGMAALGIDQAPGHIELRLGENGPSVIEIAARLGGGYITSDLVPLATGVDLVRAAIAVSLGRPPDIACRHRRGAAISFACASPGQILSISGLDQVRAEPTCHDAEIYCRAGDSVPKLTDASARMGHVIAVAETGEDALDAADRLVARLDIETAMPEQQEAVQ